MLSTKEVQAELQKQEDGDEISVKDFVKSNGGEISVLENHIEVAFPKNLTVKEALCGQTFRASTWHNLRATMLHEGRIVFGEQ